VDEEYMEKLLTVCNRILEELEVLSSTAKATVLNKFQKDFLKTQQQQDIFLAIDGVRSTQDISDVTGASIRAVQLLLKDLKVLGLVNEQKSGRSTIPSKNIGQVAVYCAKQCIGGSKDE
jgi:predicted transcriptional regulator